MGSSAGAGRYVYVSTDRLLRWSKDVHCIFCREAEPVCGVSTDILRRWSKDGVFCVRLYLQTFSAVRQNLFVE